MTRGKAALLRSAAEPLMTSRSMGRSDSCSSVRTFSRAPVAAWVTMDAERIRISLLAAPCSGPGERDHLNNNKNLTLEVVRWSETASLMAAADPGLTRAHGELDDGR